MIRSELVGGPLDGELKDLHAAMTQQRFLVHSKQKIADQVGRTEYHQHVYSLRDVAMLGTTDYDEPIPYDYKGTEPR